MAKTVTPVSRVLRDELSLRADRLWSRIERSITGKRRHWPWSVLQRWSGIGGGQPVFRHTGLLVRPVYGMWIAGDSIAELALDYGLHPAVIEQGLREWAGRPRHWRSKVPIRASSASSPARSPKKKGRSR